MEGYLGEFPVDITTSEYADWQPAQWALYYIERYGAIDGDHHKTWVLDQIARILHGTPVIVTEARWDDGKIEHRVITGAATDTYHMWCDSMMDEDSEDYDIGIPP
jgi:hypothetical protein